MSPDLEEAFFSVRRSRRLASFPSRFAKKVRAGRMRVEPVSGAGHPGEEDMAVKHPMGHDLEKDTTTPNNSTSSQTTADAAEPDNICCQNGKEDEVLSSLHQSCCVSPHDSIMQHLSSI